MVSILVIIHDLKKHSSSAINGCMPYSKYTQNKRDEKFIFESKLLMFPS